MARSLGENTDHDPWTALRDDAQLDAAAQRRRDRDLSASINGEDATWAGTLLNASERGAPITLLLVDGSTRIGRPCSLGRDVVIVATQDGELAVPFPAIAAMETEFADRIGDRDASRTVQSEATFTSVLQDRAPLRPKVWLHVRAGESRAGTLESCGHDVVAVRTDQGRLLHVRIDALTAVRFGR